MSDLNPYEESLAIDLATAQARIVGFESAMRKRAMRIEELEAKLAKQDDLIKERSDEVQAAVTAALTEAADAIAEYPRVAPDAVEAEHYDEQIEHSQSIILALITPDAQAALDRVVAAERERCAKVAENFWLATDSHLNSIAATAGGCIAHAIRKGGK